MAFYVQARAQATLVLKTSQLPGSDWLDRNFQQTLRAIGMEGLWLHLHPAAGKRLFTRNGWRLIWGKSRSLNREALVYGPSAFQQLIPNLYKQALDEAGDFLSPSRHDYIIDLYCGIGTSLRRWVNRGARTLGVELSGEAVECARQNAPHAPILRGKCAHRIPQIGNWLDKNAKPAGQRFLYVNPPRTGIESEVLSWIVNDFRPQRIAYLSCSAGTLRRDLNVLQAFDYQIERITPYDFFPQTYHVETLVLLKAV